MARKHPFYYEKDVIAFARLMERHPGLSQAKSGND